MRSAAPPVASLLGLAIDDVGAGRARVVLPASRELRWTRDTIPGPVLLLLADAAVGVACQAALPAGRATTTGQLSLVVHAEVEATGELLVAEGVAGDRVLPTATRAGATIRNARGALIAECSALMTERTIGGAPPAAAPRTAQSNSTRSMPPLQRLIGLRRNGAHHGRAVWRMPASPLLCGLDPSQLYGGATALVAGMAAVDAADVTAALRRLTVRLRRIVRADGSELLAHGTVQRRVGRDLTARAHVIDAHGDTVATALATLSL